MAIIKSPKRSLRSGDLAEAAGLSTDTLRHYERLGILKKPPRTDGGDRAYPADALDRVNLIRNALGSRFTLQGPTPAAPSNPRVSGAPFRPRPPAAASPIHPHAVLAS